MENKVKKGPTIRYGFLQTGYWIDDLIIANFAALFLSGRGFSTSQIGILTAAAALVSCFLQQFAGSFSDRYSDVFPLKYFLSILLGICIACFLGLAFVPEGFLSTFVFYFTAISLQAVINPLLNALCLQFTNNGYQINFGVARAMGSIGYAISGLVMGRITDQFGSEIILPVYLAVYITAFVILMFFFPIPQKDHNVKTTAGNQLVEEQPSTMKEFFHKYHRFMVLMVGFVCMWFETLLMNTYMIYFIQDLGGNAGDMGTTLFVMAVAEIPAILFGNNIMKKIGAGKMLVIAALGGAVKSVLFFIAPDIHFFILLNFMHFFLSGFYQVSAVYYCYAIVGEKDIVKGQTVLGMTVYGIGCTIANYLGGIMLERMPHQMILFLCILLSVLGFFIILYVTDPKHFKNEKIRNI